MKSYKSPLNVFVVWHPSFEQGEALANFVYKTFSRDVSAPLGRGLGIPVYFRSVPRKGKPTPLPIPLTEADYTAVVVLVDDQLFNDDDWNQFVKDLIPKRTHKVRLFPVALSKNAFYFEETTFSVDQFINLVSAQGLSEAGEFEKACATLKSRLLHGLCRLLLNREESQPANPPEAAPPIQLFISHAKADGEGEAAAFRDYVRANTKLSSFFDTNDIADGYQFDKQIESAIKNGHAALVVFHTDAYSSREWCRIEILTAKRFKAPIVVVYHITSGEKRSFPYMGNVPTIRFQANNFNEIVDVTLYQVLNNLFHMQNLKKIKDLYVSDQYESIELTSPPELFNYIDILNKVDKSSARKHLVLYPDPPIGIEEIRVLEEIDSQIYFLTPIQLSVFSQ